MGGSRFPTREMSRLGNLGRVDADSPAFTCLAFARLTAKAKSAPALPSEPKCSWRGRSSSDQLGKQGLAQVRRCVEFQLGGHVLSPRVRAQVASGPGVETLSGCDPGSLLPAPSRMRPFRANFKPPLAPFAISPELAFRGERSQISCPAKIAGAGARSALVTSQSSFASGKLGAGHLPARMRARAAEVYD